MEKEHETLIVAFESHDGTLVDILNAADDFELTYDQFGIPVDCTVYLTHSNPTIFIKARDKVFIEKRHTKPRYFSIEDKCGRLLREEIISV